ncbi:hypothetical protein [Mucilaginibacter ginsenosidivorax]|uniref:hypothetical protein n=1 Tax=Mucilaginibacter ginsenosidivorax TaxID=862126 RepID=UPI001CEFAA1C|nr:hypothetical protein [Mucilaginibacter ginsenosidivorax]
MMRQLGGSFGIALINTFISHRAAANRNALVSHIMATDPATNARLSFAVKKLIDHGATCLTATQQALAILEQTVVRQTYLLSYMNAFLLLSILNACCIILAVLTIKKKNTPTGKIYIPDH